MSRASGATRTLAFLTFNDCHFNQHVIDPATYNYFKWREPKTSAGFYMNRVWDVARRVIIGSDSLSTEQRVNNIFGLTVYDLLEMDLATLIELEDQINKIEEEQEEERRIKAKALDEINKAQNLQKPPKG